MSGNKLVDDYLSDLMDEADEAPAASDTTGEAASSTTAESLPADHGAERDVGGRSAGNADGEPAPAAQDDASEACPNAETDGEAITAGNVDSDPACHDGDAGAPVGTAADESPATTGATIEPAGATPADADPLAAFRQGGKEIGEDEFDAMLDVLQGRTAPPAVAAAATVTDPPSAPADDPLAAFREGGKNITDDEFDAMLDALEGKAPSTPSQPAAAPAESLAPPPPFAPPTPPAEVPAHVPAAVVRMLVPDAGSSPPTPIMSPEPPRERHRRADERISSWLRFSIGRQHFAVEVLKVQEVLRVPMIMPVRGTERGMLGVMNLRGQIVPILDLAVRLGFPCVEPTEASRVIVLEENGETLGLLVATVADVSNISDGKIERISGTPSLVAADIVRGIARREGSIIILLDASRLLA